MEKMAILYARYAGNAFGVAAPLVHTISVQCLLLHRTTAMRRTPLKLHRTFGDDVSPLRCRQNYLDKLPVFRLVIVAIQLKMLCNVMYLHFDISKFAGAAVGGVGSAISSSFVTRLRLHCGIA